VTLKVLSVASEAVPLVKTGGLADVAGALPAALAACGVEVTTLVPGYRQVIAGLGKARAVHKWNALLGEPARLVSGSIGGHPLLVLDAPTYFDRPGGPYGDASGNDWPDNWRRFGALARAAADLGAGGVKGLAFDLVHAHDWQAALTPAYLQFAPVKGGRTVPSVVTIHNMAFQGYFDAAVFPRLGLPQSAWSVDGIESYGGVGFLKAGMQLADAITTVSPTYAHEIRSPAFGMGLEGIVLARSNRVHGILNGIDPAEWSPANDPHLAVRYGPAQLSRRTANKRALEKEFGLARDDGPLFVVVSRLTWQKGMDVLIEVLDHLVGIGGRLALLGSGDRAPPGSHRRAHRLRRGAVAPDAGRWRRDPGPEPVRAVRTDPALRPRLRVRTGGLAHRGSRRHGDRREPRRACRWRRDGHPDERGRPARARCRG
jgi:starch synthase